MIVEIKIDNFFRTKRMLNDPPTSARVLLENFIEWNERELEDETAGQAPSESALTITDLPTELLISMFAHVPYEDTVVDVLKRVCRRFRDMLTTEATLSYLYTEILEVQAHWAHKVVAGQGKHDATQFAQVFDAHVKVEEIVQMVAASMSPEQTRSEAPDWQQDFAKYLFLIHRNAGMKVRPRLGDESEVDMLLTTRYVAVKLACCVHVLYKWFFPPVFREFLPGLETCFLDHEYTADPVASFERCFLRANALDLIHEFLSAFSPETGPLTGRHTIYSRHHATYPKTRMFRVPCDPMFGTLGLEECSEKGLVFYLLDPRHVICNGPSAKQFAIGTQSLLKRALEASSSDGALDVIKFMEENGESGLGEESNAARCIRRHMAEGDEIALCIHMIEFDWENVIYEHLLDGNSRLRQSMPTPENLLKEVIAAER